MFLESYENTSISHISMAAILDFCTLYCFEIFYFDFLEFRIPINLGVDTKMNLLMDCFNSYK